MTTNNIMLPFYYSGGDTNGNCREYYRNCHLEAISPVVVVTIFQILVFYKRAYDDDLSQTIYELKARVVYTVCRYNNNSMFYTLEAKILNSASSV